MKRSAFAGLGAALVAALAIPILVGVTAAGATTTCDTGQFPKTPGGQSGLKIFCTFDAPGTFPKSVIEVTTPGGGGASILYQTSAAHGFADGEGVTTSGFERGKYNRTDYIETGGSCSIGTAGGGACDTDEFEMNGFGSAPASVTDLAIRARTADGTDVVYTTGSGGISVPHQLADGTRVRITGFTPTGYNGNFVIQTFGSCSTGTGTAGACTASEFEVANTETGAVTTFGGIEVVFGTASIDNAVGSITVHDAENGVWRRGAARTITITTSSSSSTSFTIPSGELHGTRDLGRPVSDPGVVGSILRGGTFIRTLTPAACTTACTGGTLSQTAAAAGTSTDALVEHTSSFVTYANCPVPPATQFGPGGGPFSNLNVATRDFDSDDIGLSVSGGPFAHGSRIDALGNNNDRVMVLPDPFDGEVSCSQARPLLYPSVIERVTIGAADYGTATGTDYSTQYEETYLRTIQRDSGSGYTCSGSTITLGAEGDDGGGFNSYDIDLVYEFFGTGAATGTITGVTSSTVATLSGSCAASSSRITIGEASASAPGNDHTVMTLGATLELNPGLVPEQDDCSAGTPEGFLVTGLWENPGNYTPASTDPVHTIGQITFPTAVVSFNGYVVNVPGGDTEQSAAHYDFVFPALPTSTAVCPGTSTAITLGLDPTTKFDSASDVPSGSGNPAGPSVRSLGPMLSAVSPFTTFSQVIEINDSLGDPVAASPYTSTACTITSPGTIDFACGDG